MKHVVTVNEQLDRLQQSERDAWVSFYVACAVVGILLAAVVWQRFAYRPQCGAAAVPSNVLQLPSVEIRASASQVTEI